MSLSGPLQIDQLSIVFYSVQWCLGDENIFYTSIQSSCVHSHGHILHQKYNLITTPSEVNV
jgi:hypothetical protein